jgi:hypothetical protein
VARPTKYSEKLASELCAQLASGDSLRTICSRDEFPTKTTVLRWLFDDQYNGFRDQYTKARAMQAEILAEEMIDIADDGTNDWMERNGKDNEGWQQNGEAIARSRLRVDTRKWVASKLLPKMYGEQKEERGDKDNDLAEALSKLADALPD